MLIDALIVSIIIGFICRGSLKDLATLEIRALPAMVAAMLVQFVFLELGGRQWEFALRYGRYFYVLSFLILLWALWQNRSEVAFLAIGAGVLMNFIVIVANGGFMPVSEAGLLAVGLEDMVPQLLDRSYITHGLMNEGTRLKWLADVFPTPAFYPRAKVFSLGDILMALGILWLIPKAMLGKTSLQRKTAPEGMIECSNS